MEENDVLMDVTYACDLIKDFCEFYRYHEHFCYVNSCIAHASIINTVFAGHPVKFLSPVGTGRTHKTLFAIIELDNIYEIGIYTGFLNSDSAHESISTSLNETKKLNLDITDRIIVFRDIHHSFYNLVRSFLETKNLEVQKQQHYYIYRLLEQQTPIFDPDEVPEGVEVRNLMPADVSKLVGHSPPIYANSDPYLRKLLLISGGYGLFSRTDGELLSWGLRSMTGAIDSVHTVEKVQRQGYATYVVNLLCMEFEENGDPVAFVPRENKSAQAFFKFLGFQNVGISHTMELKKHNSSKLISSNREKPINKLIPVRGMSAIKLSISTFKPFQRNTEKTEKAAQSPFIFSAPSKRDREPARPSTKKYSSPSRQDIEEPDSSLPVPSSPFKRDKKESRGREETVPSTATLHDPSRRDIEVAGLSLDFDIILSSFRKVQEGDIKPSVGPSNPSVRDLQEAGSSTAALFSPKRGIKEAGIFCSMFFSPPKRVKEQVGPSTPVSSSPSGMDIEEAGILSETFSSPKRVKVEVKSSSVALCSYIKFGSFTVQDSSKTSAEFSTNEDTDTSKKLPFRSLSMNSLKRTLNQSSSTSVPKTPNGIIPSADYNPVSPLSATNNSNMSCPVMYLPPTPSPEGHIPELLSSDSDSESSRPMENSPRMDFAAAASPTSDITSTPSIEIPSPPLSSPDSNESSYSPGNTSPEMALPKTPSPRISLSPIPKHEINSPPISPADSNPENSPPASTSSRMSLPPTPSPRISITLTPSPENYSQPPPSSDSNILTSGAATTSPRLSRPPTPNIRVSISLTSSPENLSPTLLSADSNLGYSCSESASPDDYGSKSPTLFVDIPQPLSAEVPEILGTTDYNPITTRQPTRNSAPLSSTKSMTTSHTELHDSTAPFYENSNKRNSNSETYNSANVNSGNSSSGNSNSWISNSGNSEHFNSGSSDPDTSRSASTSPKSSSPRVPHC